MLSRKLIAALLAALMLVTMLMPGVSALTYDEYNYIYSSVATKGFTVSTSNITIEPTVSTKRIVRLTTPAGSYDNNVIFAIKPTEFALSDRPIIKVCYRTNSPSDICDLTISCPGGENWPADHPAITGDGEWHEFIFDYNDINSSKSAQFPEAGARNVTLRLKPFGAGKFTLENDSYFEIKYIGFFENQAEAEAFEYMSNYNDKYSYNVLTPAALYHGVNGSNTVSQVKLSRQSTNESFIRYLAYPGTYNNNQLVLSFTHTEFSLTERPYVKLMYRTNSPTNELNVSLTSENGENWMARHPSQITDGEFHTIILNVNDINARGGDYTAPDGSMNINLRLKPWGSQTKTITEESYYDIVYVAFFETAAEAEAFDYPGDSAYPYAYGSDSSDFEYNFADNSVILGYIKDADVRKNEIIHTNNSFPNMRHLTSDHFTYSTVEDTTGKYVRLVPTGEHEIIFIESDMDFANYPIMKLSYRSNGTDALFDTNGIKKTDIMDLSAIPDFEGGSSLSLAPWSASASEGSYFDIEYIAFFKTVAEAKKFEFKDNGANMTESLIVYDADLLDPANVPSQMRFISADGDDSNDGKTPDTAWKTVSKLQKTSIASGTTVFFRRGDTFRFTGSITTKNGCTYTAYGMGDKPILTAAIDGKGADKWEATEWENVWHFKQNLGKGANTDVGHIRINGGSIWGIKVIKLNNNNMRLNNGNVFNGRTYIDSYSAAIETESGDFDGNGLCNDLEFYHDYDTGEFYLYCEDGNPGEVFDSVELGDKGNAIATGGGQITLDNLLVTGCGSHGMGGGTMENFTAQNCRLEWIGGSIQTLQFSEGATVPTRFGNAIEAYGGAKNFTIRNCYASQVYDCCWTVQNQEAVVFDGVFMYDNVAEYSNSGLEVWQSGGTTENMYLHDNYTLFGGYGWSHQRSNKDGNFFYGGTGIRSTVFTNCSAENNVNVLAYRYGLLASEIGSTRYNFNHNVYIMEEGKYFTYAPYDTENGLMAAPLEYDRSTLRRITSLGTEKGSDFYYAAPGTFNIGDDPYEVFGVSEVPVEAIDAPSEITMTSGERITPELTFTPANASNTATVIESSNDFSVIVTDGELVAKHPGVSYVTVRSIDTGVSTIIKVIVKNDPMNLELWSTDALGEASAAFTNVDIIGDSHRVAGSSVISALTDKLMLSVSTSASADMTASDMLAAIENGAATKGMILLAGGYGDYANNTGVAAYAGELEKLFEKLLESNAYSFISFITPYRIPETGNGIGETPSEYVDAALALCNKYGIVTLDLYNDTNAGIYLYDKNGNAGDAKPQLIDSGSNLTEKGAALIGERIINALRQSDTVSFKGEFKGVYRYDAAKLSTVTTPSSPLRSDGLIEDEENGKTYLRISAGSNGTSNDNTQVEFDINGVFKLKEYPVMKLNYRANVSRGSAAFDVNFITNYSGQKKRLWVNSKYTYQKDNAPASTIIDLSSVACGGDGISYSYANIDDSAPFFTLRLKPFYPNNQSITQGDYIDVESIEFYKTVADAERGYIEEPETTVQVGDANADGSFDTADTLVLARALANIGNFNMLINYEASDVNGDGHITFSDLAIIARHFAGWRGYETLPLY